MEHIQKIIEEAAQQTTGESVQVELTRPDEQFGDFATNVALQLAKKVGKNPREVAESIVSGISGKPGIKAVTIAGPGFINVTVEDAVLLNLTKITKHSTEAKEVVIETNNPNPFKAMHIGHAFNAILGDTIANLLAVNGDTVHRVSYHGDVGVHVGKSMYSLLNYIDGVPEKLHEIPESERNTFMSRMYAEGSKAYQDDDNAHEQIDELAAQSFMLDDPTYRTVYETCKQWSFDQIDGLVARLGNQPIEKRYLESQADTLGVKTVREHVGDVFIESEGALVFPGQKYGIFDNVFVSSNGRGLYGARDLGLMQLKNNDFHGDKSYIVTAEEQRDYFRGVIKAAELCLPELTGITTNISTGTVKLTSGKMSSRSGEVVEVNWLFDQVAEAIKERGSEVDDDVIAGSLRYQFLKVRIGSDVIFDIEDAVSLQGNSGPYLQYAYARACSILEKSGDTTSEITSQLETDERSLLRKTSEYTEVLEHAARELLPHVVCTYLYELTQSFNRFYENNRVIDHDRQALRVELVKLYAQTLKAGLTVLGIPAPEKM